MPVSLDSGAGQTIDLTTHTHTQYKEMSDSARGLCAYVGTRFSN